MIPDEQHDYLIEHELPFRFCPGCTHGTAVKALTAAFEKLQPPRKSTVVVTDIGCVGLADRYLNVSTFHGLHGRSIAYAMGLKVARPELTVVNIMGDGGVGIGAAHLLSAARRNVGITVLVLNNFNFGMTGGQQSVTTFQGSVTSTSPDGNPERPLDVCAVARAAGATFVARISAFDRTLPDVLAQAIAHPGFALVDVWEICTAHFMKANDFHKKELEAALCEVERGVLVSEVRPELSATLRSGPGGAGLSSAPAAFDPLAKLRVPVAAPAKLSGPRSVAIAGSAGQKVRYAASLLARSAVMSGLHAAQQDEFPITVLTGFSVSDVIVSPSPIDHLEREPADILVAIADEGYERFLRRGRAARVTYRMADVATRAANERIIPLVGSRREHVALHALGHVVREEGPVELSSLRDAVSRFGFKGVEGKELAAQLAVLS